VQTRNIGPLEVSLVGLGCNNFGRRIDAEATDRVVHAALDAGITLFDTADVYGDGRSEELLGAALGARRDEAVIASKFGMELDEDHRGAHPDYVRSACDDSLRRLGVDHIDLYQLHRPDPDVPIADTLGALGELIEAGKVRTIGHSNLEADQMDQAEAAACSAAVPRFECAQDRWNLLERGPRGRQARGARAQRADAPALLPAGVRSVDRQVPGRAGRRSLLAAREPAGGSSRGPAGRRPARHRRAPHQLREARGRSLLELAISWLAGQPVVASVIAGATRPEQVLANVDAAEWKLTEDELAEVDGITGRAA
jgi:aryl-alcohol dehydrogenase-like predicted oxidoreductase